MSRFAFTQVRYKDSKWKSIKLEYPIDGLMGKCIMLRELVMETDLNSPAYSEHYDGPEDNLIQKSLIYIPILGTDREVIALIKIANFPKEELDRTVKHKCNSISKCFSQCFESILTLQSTLLNTIEENNTISVKNKHLEDSRVKVDRLVKCLGESDDVDTTIQEANNILGPLLACDSATL